MSTAGDERRELFIFPDGTQVEVIVFQPASSARRAPRRPQPALPDASAPERRPLPDCAVPPPPKEASQAEEPPHARETLHAQRSRGTDRATPATPAGAPAPAGSRVDVAPSACPVCGGEFVYPVEWERNSEGTWNLCLRCPECETRRRIILGRRGVEALNRTLYESIRALAEEAAAVSRRNFEEQAARLVKALSRDLILPMDF